MGCSTSKLDDEESVQLCKDRKKFIRQAVEQRMKFASGHVAYIQAMKRVSAALREYIDGDEPREFLLDSYTTTTPTLTPPIKKKGQGFISISPNSFSVTPFKPEPNSSFRIHCFKSGGNPSVSVEERPPQSPETYRVETYSSPAHHFGMDSMFRMQSSSPMRSSFFQYSPNNRPNYPPPSPTTSQWDFFWNPFSSLDYYGYPTGGSLDPAMLDDDESTGLQQLREEEGIPELEEETEYEEIDESVDKRDEKNKHHMNFEREEVVVEDADDDTDDDDDDSDCDVETDDDIRELPSSRKHDSIEVSKPQNVGQINKKETVVADCESKEETTPGFTVYVNRRPTSMAEVIKDLEDQFTAACKAAGEMSVVLEASRAKYASSSNDLTAMNMLNPVALFRSASRSSSSRFLVSASTSRDDGYESTSDFSDESCAFSGSHQSTLDRLFAWEKKLYQEVRAGERVRIAYEKKCLQLRNQDAKGEDPSFVDKTRATIRDLHTRIKVSIHSVEAISKRIETLRDEELEPQLLELVQGLARMWKVMAECHQRQKRTLDEAKILLAGTPSKLSGTKRYTIVSPSEPHRLARSASNLEKELRNWRASFDAWIVSQRSYVRALAAWLLRCVRPDPDAASKFPFSPRRSSSAAGAPPIFDTCIQWSNLLDTMGEAQVLDGMDFFAAGIGSLYAQQLREDSRPSRRFSGEGAAAVGSMEMVEAGGGAASSGGGGEVVMSAEKMGEVGIRVVCAGMSVAVSALTEFALGSAEGYADLIKKWENNNNNGSKNDSNKQSLEGKEDK
ncbi:protein ROLLING AND ERECT LEAF 2-like [Andrographis paniculata]|uniref:protein ROLLING AND ERECT LEAF 2-like n=1 Tax=Andrographis paniculata TaxID=175694 RepID=UPI0021E8AE09|nr:protein ROLLING AND ERECT LEAF 2-like [Andrographis paniculata]XP_051114252.1 protein ROLLING AND ERECT LEAF 2-like [Andrographis paniculata]XP_051114253.1 protein ROLLING AND ERECT LEAF 2-like [Andrographis paniculata]